VLCIGDSITYGELALWNKDNYTNNHSYPLACKEFFMKDAIDNGYIGKDDKGIHLLREDIFLKAKTEFRRAKPVKPKIELNIIMD
jgi:hypothetical protein